MGSRIQTHDWPDGERLTAPPALLASLCAEGRIAFHNDGDCIHHRGDPTLFATFVLEGAVRLSTVGVDGRRLISGRLTRGECFAIYQLFAGAPRTHDAHAEGAVQVVTLSLPMLRDLMAREPALSEFLVLYHARRLVRTMETLEDERRLSLRVRLAKRILAGCRQEEPLRRSQSDLADELGVSRYAVGTALADLSRRGLVDVAFCKIQLRDRSMLRAWIDSESSTAAP